MSAALAAQEQQTLEVCVELEKTLHLLLLASAVLVGCSGVSAEAVVDAGYNCRI
jgi:hypothetical protein